MAASPTQWLGGTETHLVDLLLSKLRTHLDGVWVDDATGIVHQVKATGNKELEMHTDVDGHVVKKRKVLLDASLEGGTRAHWDAYLTAFSGGRCAQRSKVSHHFPVPAQFGRILVSPIH